MEKEPSLGIKRNVLFIVLIGLAILFLIAVWHKDLKKNLVGTASWSRHGKTEQLKIAKLEGVPQPVVIRKKIYPPSQKKPRKVKSTPTVIVINAGTSDTARKEDETAPALTAKEIPSTDKKPDQETTTVAGNEESASQKTLAQSMTGGENAASQTEDVTIKKPDAVEQNQNAEEKQGEIKPTQTNLSLAARITGKDAGQPREIPPHPYSILLSSCRLPESVQKVVSDSKELGLNPYIVKVKIRNNDWFRIFSGYYTTEGEALQVKQKYGLNASIIKKTPFTNLIGIFPSKSEASKKLPPLVNLGYSPYVVKSADNTFRVVVGAFVTRENAEKQKLELQSKGIDNIVITR